MKSQDERRKRFWLTYLNLCLIPLWVSCRTQPALVLQPVGPPASGVSLGELDSRSEGFLKVFTATEIRQVGNESKYYPHTDYMIYNTNGTVFQYVENSLDATDETPALVSLPAGLYRIRAQDDDYGRVIVPVLIQPWRTTKVYLESRANESSEHLKPTDCVLLPDGRIVGWRATELAPKTDHGDR